MLSDLHRYNLSILADYLLKLPIDYAHFRMTVYNRDSRGSFYTDGVNPNECGTAACAVGHVPYTGIIGWEAQPTWNAVAEKLLGAEPGSGLFNFLFGGWNIDCPWQAAWRIRHYLETGQTEGQYLPHGLSVEQFANCKKLATYLLELPDDYDQFDMWWYTQNGEPPQNTDCGTVACAAGHGPAAGIEPKPNEGWESYTKRVFSSSHWMFASTWSRHDNTAHGAAKRIIYALRNRTLPEIGDVSAYA